jgi:hypothetical protein
MSPRLFGHRPPVVGGLAKHPLSFHVFGLIGQLIALRSFGVERFRFGHDGAPFSQAGARGLSATSAWRRAAAGDG